MQIADRCHLNLDLDVEGPLHEWVRTAIPISCDKACDQLCISQDNQYLLEYFKDQSSFPCCSEPVKTTDFYISQREKHNTV